MHATEMLKDIPFFKGLSEDTLAELEARTTVKRLEDGEVYLNAGQAPKAFCVVLSGQLKFYRVNKAGKEQVFGYGKANDVFGLSALTDAYRAFPVSCISRANNTEIAEIELSAVREIMHREPHFAVAVLTEQSRRYGDMLDLVDQLSLKDAHNRLAKWLDTWIEENHPGSGDAEILVVLPFTQSEIAAQIGTVREVVSRGFSRMEKDGILRASGKRVTIQSRKRLRQMGDQ